MNKFLKICLGLLTAWAFFTPLFSAQRVVLCEEFYQET